MQAKGLTIRLAATSLLLTSCLDPDLRRGDNALGQGRYDEAISAYEAARTRLPEKEHPRDRLASAHRSLAMTLVSQGRCDDARPHYALARALTGPVLIDHQQLYECDVTRDVAPENLVEDLKVLVELGDKRPSVLRKLIQLELTLGRDEEAVKRLVELEAQTKLSSSERKRFVELLLRLDRRELVWPHLLELSRLEPLDPITRLKLAELAEQRGEHGLAAGIYEKMSLEFPNNPMVFLRLADFRTARGDADGARVAQAWADELRGASLAPTEDKRPLKKSRR